MEEMAFGDSHQAKIYVLKFVRNNAWLKGRKAHSFHGIAHYLWKRAARFGPPSSVIVRS
jgi:hypothetical protein